MPVRHGMRGASLIDVLIGSALMLTIFLALIGLLRVSLLLTSLAKAEEGAVAVGNSQMEYIRSLPYASVGTTHGIPAGVVPEFATTTENSIDYGTRTFIDYYDDPSDGTSTADTNGITTDYKRIKVAVTYSIRGKLYEHDFVSNYAPIGIETTAGGGTLKVQVVDSHGAAVPGATVAVVNASTSPTINVTTFSDASGQVLLGGAPASSQYQVFVSKNGYSSAQTYVRDTTNQNPNPGFLTVVLNTTTTGTFAIDRLSTFSLATYYPIRATSTTDTFVDASKLASQTNTTVTGSALQLSSGGSGYVSSGSARSVAIAPAYLASWTSIEGQLSAPANTSVRVQVGDGTGALIPDSAIPGNSSGFSSLPISLLGLSTTTYPSLTLIANLSTTDASSTPSVLNWQLNSMVGPIPVPNVPFTLTGAKTIGTTGASVPIYKTVVSTTTGASAVSSQQLEWDSYTLSVPGYDIVDACAPPPYALSAGTTVGDSLYLGTASTNELLVAVYDSSGAVVPGATVSITSGGGPTTGTSSSCGAAYFGSLTSGTYSVTISKSGYTTTTFTSVSVSGHTIYAATFP